MGEEEQCDKKRIHSKGASAATETHPSLSASSLNSSNILIRFSTHCIFLKAFLIVFYLWSYTTHPNQVNPFPSLWCILKICGNLSELVEIHFEFPQEAPNQASPQSNPIRQLDLTNWQTEHSANSFNFSISEKTRILSTFQFQKNFCFNFLISKWEKNDFCQLSQFRKKNNFRIQKSFNLSISEHL